MKNKIVLALTLLVSNATHAAVGCMDNSYHNSSYHRYRSEKKFYQDLDPSVRHALHVLRDEKEKPEDFKLWHHVACDCPCEQYRGYYLKNRTEEKGLCVVCRHRGNPQRTSEQNIETDAAEIERDFALLKTLSN